MSAADDAYAAAERLIAEALLTGARELSFERPELRALETLPPEIASLVKVENLVLNHTNVADLSLLSGMTAIRYLRLDETRVANLAPISGLTQIFSIELRDTFVADLTPLAGLIGMHGLWLDNTPITDLAPLAGLTRIQELVLTGTRVSDLRPLAGLTDMKLLILDGTHVTDLGPISNMTALYGLHLEQTKIADLSPLASLAGPFSLILDNTPISDLSPLAAKKDIYDLSINNTDILDLRPVRGFPKLTEGEGYLGLRFQNCAAARADARIAEIAEIADNTERAQTLFDYLKDWVPPGVVVVRAPEPDALLPVFSSDGRLEIAASLPSEAERDERLKQALHERLKPKAAKLAQAAGNRFPRLAARARALAAQVDKPFAALDMLLVHLEIEDLAARAALGREDGEEFGPEVSAALSDVVRIGPGLTLDNADVELLEERKRRYAANVPPPEVQAAHDRLSAAVAADKVAIGDNLRALEQRNVETAGQLATGAVQVSLHRNTLIKIARLAVGGLSLAASVFGIWGFVETHWAVIQPLLSFYGPAFSDWFLSAIGQVQDLAGLVANVEVKPLADRRARK